MARRVQRSEVGKLPGGTGDREPGRRAGGGRSFLELGTRTPLWVSAIVNTTSAPGYDDVTRGGGLTLRISARCGRKRRASPTPVTRVTEMAILHKSPENNIDNLILCYDTSSLCHVPVFAIIL